jgi:hypothetical protein
MPTEEGFWDKLYEKAQAELLDFEQLPEGWDDEDDVIARLINIAHDLAYDAGFQDGRYEATMEYEAKAEPMPDQPATVIDLHSREVHEALDRR